MAHGPWPWVMGHGHGPRVMGHGPWPMAHAHGHGPWAMAHAPWPMAMKTFRGERCEQFRQTKQNRRGHMHTHTHTHTHTHQRRKTDLVGRLSKAMGPPRDLLPRTVDGLYNRTLSRHGV